jgi:hypothetical protein
MMHDKARRCAHCTTELVSARLFQLCPSGLISMCRPEARVRGQSHWGNPARSAVARAVTFNDRYKCPVVGAKSNGVLVGAGLRLTFGC